MFGGDGATTVLLCGGYHFAAGRSHPLRDILPPLIHVTTAAASAGHDLALVAGLLTREVASSGIGTATVTNRLVDALFVYILRAWLADQPAGSAGWLGALRDPVIGRALSLLHTGPGRPWLVEDIARQVGMSRSGFAQRFQDLTGDTPGRYISRLRTDRAAQLLRDTDDSILQSPWRWATPASKRSARPSPASTRPRQAATAASTAAPETVAGPQADVGGRFGLTFAADSGVHFLRPLPVSRALSPSLVSYWSPARTEVMRCVLKPSQCIRPT